ncbi:MAG: hypothetical protein ACHQ0J_13490 [Candidatus Dormibacterales bacterium]
MAKVAELFYARLPEDRIWAGTNLWLLQLGRLPISRSTLRRDLRRLQILAFEERIKQDPAEFEARLAADDEALAALIENTRAARSQP